MQFKLSVGIYNTDQHKKIITKLTLVLAPLILILLLLVIYVVGIAENAINFQEFAEFFKHFYAISPIFLVFMLLLTLALPLVFLSAKSREKAYIKINDVGIKCHLPLFARNLENGLCKANWDIPWATIDTAKLIIGKRTNVRGINSPPASRLNTTRLEIKTPNSKLTLIPFLWLDVKNNDHRLTLENTLNIKETEVIELILTCPFLTAFKEKTQIPITLVSP